MINIGTIVNTKGLKGEVKILSSSDFKEERFKKGSIIYILDDNKEYIPLEITNWYNHKNFDIVKLKGYDFIDKVEFLMSKKIYAQELDSSVLAKGEYFFSDLLNFKVVEHEKLVGEIIDVFDYAKKTYLKIKLVEGNEKMIPYVEEFIKSVDKENKVVNIEVIEGLLYDKN